MDAATWFSTDGVRIGATLVAGLALGGVLEFVATPTRSRGSSGTLVVGAGLWTAAFAVLTWALARPVAALVLVLSGHLAVVGASDVRAFALRAPIVVVATLIAAFVIGGAEPTLSADSTAPLAVLLAAAIALVRITTESALPARRDNPSADPEHVGLVVSLWLDLMARRRDPEGPGRTCPGDRGAALI